MLLFKTTCRYSLLLLFTALVSSNIVHAQDSKEERIAAQAAAVKNLIESKNYVFVPTSVSPQSGRTRQLTSSYFLKISKDTVESDLPYFGRAYTAPINSSDAGINFTSTNFEYTETLGKKGAWNITIKLKDQTQAREMNLTIFSNGRTDLIVSSNSRQSISFSGDIGPGK